MQKDWISLFSDWLTMGHLNGKNHYYCKICECSIKAKKDNVYKHMNSKKHKKRGGTIVHESYSEPFHGKVEVSDHVNEITPDESVDVINCNSSPVFQTDCKRSLSLGQGISSFANKRRKPNFYYHNEMSSEICPKPEEDELDIFGKFITAQLRKLPEEHAVSLTLEIHGLIAQKRYKALSDKDTQTDNNRNTKVITVSIDNDESFQH